MCVCAELVARGRCSVDSQNSENLLLCLKKFHDSTLNKFKEH